MILKDSIGRKLYKLERSVNKQGFNLLKNYQPQLGPLETGGPGPVGPLDKTALASAFDRL
jgi:hypothetical protein